jgi:lipoprotein-anchoring transpeptidase ErfK/SrfK
VRITKILVGLSAVVAIAGAAACSTHTTNAADGAHLAVAGQTDPVMTSTVDPPITTTTTTPPVTTTTTKPAVTTTTKPKPVDTRTAAQKAGVPCAAAVRACVDLSARKAWLISDGKVVYGPVSIMSGRVGWPTPVGTFHVQFKSAHYVSHEFHVPMPDAVFFYPGIAFHEGSLHAHSHGCIHLSATSASKFFHTLSAGDEVQVLR